MNRLVFSLAFLLCVLPLSAVAGTKQSASIDLSEPVVISGAHLEPGHYVVRWNGTGSDVQVQFLNGKKELVSVPAKLISQNNEESPAVTLRSTQDGSKTISEIDLSKVTLQFPEKTEMASQ
jgi:hypothetical protein